MASRPDLSTAVITTGISHCGKPGQDRNLREIGAVMRDSAGVRRTGAASIDLAWVAQGRFDGYWERYIQSWDIAAGIVIVREAGGLVSDMEGRQNMLNAGEIVCGNEYIHAALLKRIAAA